MAEGQSPSASLGKVDDVFLASDGRFWEKTDESTWTLRGDLTGAPGSNIFTGSGEPMAALGKDGDVYVRDDGTVWRKAGGVWTATGVDVTGPPGSSLLTGEVAAGASPPAGTGKVGDVFLASDGRFWEKTAAARWTLRGDLTGAPGSNIFTGSGEPMAALGKDGDVYVRDDGTVWRKAGGVWTATGVDVTGPPGSSLLTGEVAAGASPPAGTGKVGDVFLAHDGRFWEKTAADTWTLRGDLTGAPGSNIFTGSGEPMAALGKDGDVYVRDDGTVWRKAGGVWTATGVDVTGPPGSSLLTGEVAAGASPPAGTGKVGDTFLASDGRFWEKTAADTWTLRGDLTGSSGSDIFTGSGEPVAGLGKDGDVYVRDDGTLWSKANGVWTYTGVDVTGPPGTSLIPGDVAAGAAPSPSIGKVGDIFFNLDGRVWEKTDDTTWTSRGDITGPPGSSLIPGVVAEGELPPSNVGRVGDTFLAADGRFWEKTDATTWTYVDDLTGPPAPGGGFNPRGQWRAGIDYAVGDSVFRNFSRTIRIGPLPGGGTVTRTVRSSRSYLCKLAHTSSSSNAPSGDANTYWDAFSGDTSIDDDADDAPVVTTTAFTGYQLAARAPTTPSTTDENPPQSTGTWRPTRPPQHATLSIYELVGTRTYHDDVFQSATWVVSFVQGPIGVRPPVVTTTAFTGYQLAASSPTAPSNTDENPPQSTGIWSSTRPDPSFTLSIYRLVGTRTYHDDVFQSAVWAVTFVRGPIVLVQSFEYIYRLAESTPATPTGGMSTPNHVPAGWTTAELSATTTQGVYRSNRSVRYEDGVFIRASAWRTPTEIEGPILVENFFEYVYKRALVAPAAPSGGMSTESHVPAGWTTTELTATALQGVYRSDRSTRYENGVFIRASAWRTPTRVHAPGSSARGAETVEYVYRLAFALPPAASGGTSIEDHVPVGWSFTRATPTAVAGLFRSDRTTTRSEDGVFVDATAWSAPMRVRWPIAVVDTQEYVYRRGLTTPPTPSGGTSTEHHAPDGWSTIDPGPTPTQGVYRAERSARSEDRVFVSATAWSAPIGPIGMPGEEG